MKRTHEDAEKTRLSIVDAALKVFLEMGYSRAKISDICRVANVTRGAVYWYFRNKEDILLYLADSMAHEIEQKVNESFEQGTTNFEKTEILIKNLCFWVLENETVRNKRKVLISTFLNGELSLTEEMLFSKIMNKKIHPAEPEYIDHIVEKTCRAFGIKAETQEKKDEIYESFLAISSFVEGLVWEISRCPQRMDKKIVNNLIDRFLKGYFYSYKNILEER